MTPYFTPLIIVFVTLSALWALGKLLSLTNTKTQTTRTRQARGTEFAPGLHVVGLSEDSIREMNALIDAKEVEKLSVFLALKKPSLIELDEYIDSLRHQFHQQLKKSVKHATEIEKISAVSQLNLSREPSAFSVAKLNKTELRELLEYDSQRRRMINHEFISRFGEVNFIENFNIYVELVKGVPVTLLVGKDDKYRKHMEVFANTGVALQGRKIPLQDRLSVLKLNQLQEMAKELKLEQIFKDHTEATKNLAEIPGSAILLAMLVNIDDIFMLKPQAIDVETIQREWAMICAYAKLLCLRT